MEDVRRVNQWLINYVNQMSLVLFALSEERNKNGYQNRAPYCAS